MNKSEEYRLALLRRLQKEDQEGDAAAIKLNAEKANRAPALTRAQLPLPEGEHCPRCWLENGLKNSLEAATATDADRFDRFRCRTCEYWEDRATE